MIQRDRKIMNNFKNIENLDIRFNESLKRHTTFNIGGPADVFIAPNNIFQLKESLKLVKDLNLPLFILGKGSNIIVSDKGIRGVVLNTEGLDEIYTEGEDIISQTGILLADVAQKSLEVGLKGLEFASGIPGSLGGAIYMNAGAYGGMIKDTVKEATCLDFNGKEVTFSKDELKLSYRHSILQERPLIATRVRISLKSGDKETIREKIADLTDKRWGKQPMDMPSAGSIFKRPEGFYASALIDEAGLKGLSVGDAEVSQKHAGFIVNLGEATAKDVCNLIKKVQDIIYREKGVKLEVEPRFIGEFDS